MLTWILIVIVAFLVYLAIGFIFDRWVMILEDNLDHKYLSVPVSILFAPYILIFWIIEKKMKIEKRKIERLTQGVPDISESTARRIEREGITYRDKD